jgi:uncharacterized membrane protein
VSLYDWLLFGHVLFAGVWVGGGVAFQALALRAQRSPDPADRGRLAASAEWMGARVFVPASLLVLLFGILAALEGNWGFGEPWITIGFVAFAFSFVVGVAFLGPQAGRIGRMVATEGPGAPGVEPLMNRVLLVSRVELVVLIVAVWAMVGKPGA